jgi:glycine/D-amino acid oxidase-like deaminating enzyme
MAPPTRPQHVAVVGAGVLGSSTAAHLAEAGVAVTLVTEAGPASGASGRSLSWLNSAALRSPAYHRLRMEGIDRYRALAGALPDAGWLRFDGGLHWTDDAGEVAATAAHQRAVGYAGRLLSRAEVASHVPGIATGVVPDGGALFNPDEGWVDLPSLIEHLLGRLARSGGHLRAGVGRAELVVRAGRAVGVRLADVMTVDADAVVLAAGAAVPALLAEVGAAIPDATTAACLVRTAPVDGRPRVVLNTPRVSLRPEPDGGLVVDAGWAEAEVLRHDDGRVEVPDGLAEALLAEASTVLASHPRLRVAAVAAGLKPIPAGDEPVLGRVDGIEGLHVAFTHSGATLGLIGGELVAAEIVSGAPHPLLDPFRPSRFACR